jgi:hypothetical protein
MMTYVRFAGTLSLIIVAMTMTSVQSDAAAAASTTASSVKELAKVVLEATKTNPKLRVEDAKRKNRLLKEIASASSSSSSRSLEEGDDDDYFSSSSWTSSYDYDADMANEDFGFQLDSYSFKYTGCSTVMTYSDEQASYGGDSVLQSKRFATFRLCPTNKCSNNKYEGCTSNYGDYVVSMDQFLAAMLALDEDRVMGYCTYCESCAAIESFHKFYYESTSQQTAVVSMAKQTYQTWLSNYYQSSSYGNSNNDDSNAGAALAYYKSQQSNKSNYSNNYNGNNNNNNGYNNGNSNNNNNNNNNGYNSNSNSNNGGSSYNQWASNSQQSWNSGSSSSRYNSNSWSDMGQTYGSWYGKQVVNGHYYNGAFIEEWGYFRDDGQFMSLEEDTIEWDTYLYGDYPSSWDEDWMGATADSVQSCNYQYASSCYNQYESCMRILQNEDYMAYMEYMQSSSNGGGGGTMSSLADFLECTQVDQEYIQQYQQYLQWQKQMESQYAQQQQGYVACEGDDDGCAAQYNQNNNNANYNYDDNNYGNMNLYIGPHCGADGHTITLGVYTDATCSTYASEYSVKDILGVDVVEQNAGGKIDLFPEDCISCLAEVSPKDSCVLCCLCLQMD